VKSTLCLALCLSPFAVSVYADDAKDCKDSPLVSRFPDSTITGCEHKKFDVAKLTVTVNKEQKPKNVEGEIYVIDYRFPKTTSKAVVVRNLNNALRTAGYKFEYDSGDYGDFTVHLGKTWIMEEVSNSGNYTQTIVIESQFVQEVVASAAALSGGLASSGHAVVPGILFDTGKAIVKPESSAALDEVVKMLKQDPKLKVYVVGHTDNVGAPAANIELSRQRAAAVVQMLTSKYGVAADRLQAFGAGPYAPLQSNDSEDGRTLNRRVELVKQ
jgi:OOP family OmpA-OmpF porin